MLFTMEEQAAAEEQYEACKRDLEHPFAEIFNEILDDFVEELAREYFDENPEKILSIKVLALREMQAQAKRRECSGS